jgi:hypothetical protein
VRRGLLVGAEHDRLQRGVAGLDEVAVVAGLPAGRRVGWQAVGQRDHERVPPGAEPHHERADVEQHPVARRRLADQLGVGQRADGAEVGHVDLELHGAPPPAAYRDDRP